MARSGGKPDRKKYIRHEPLSDEELDLPDLDIGLFKKQKDMSETGAADAQQRETSYTKIKESLKQLNRLIDKDSEIFLKPLELEIKHAMDELFRDPNQSPPASPRKKFAPKQKSFLYELKGNEYVPSDMSPEQLIYEIMKKFSQEFGSDVHMNTPPKLLERYIQNWLNKKTNFAISPAPLSIPESNTIGSLKLLTIADFLQKNSAEKYKDSIDNLKINLQKASKDYGKPFPPQRPKR
jgi:hypothetical protein